MFKTILRLFLPNPLDWMIRRTAKKGGRKILLAWNRGLGDIPLGLYAVLQRIRAGIPNADITCLTRQNLADGFSMLGGVRTLIAPDWKRGEKYSVRLTLLKIGIDYQDFDLIIERPSPTDWVQWQRGTLVPQLQWDPAHDSLWKAFDLSEDFLYICAQPVAETNYGLWRNWPLERWHQLFRRLEKMPRVKVLLVGYRSEPLFPYQNVVDLRGKTTLFELLSIVKFRVQVAILPDSGILSMIYYLAASFPIRVISLWADPNHGILKQRVSSPNPQLLHRPCIGGNCNLASVSVEEVIEHIFPLEPLETCASAADVDLSPIERVGAILLAGGQGSRLGYKGPKGTFSILGKSLFQWICEKIPLEMPIAIMTSPLNHAETISFFAMHQFFGRDVHFFQQQLLPVLDDRKNPTPLFAPDGNGSVFKAFVESEICALFEQRGIDLVSIVPVDNLLANPADPSLISYVRQWDVEAAVKCIEKKPSDPPMGALFTRNGRIEIVEYIETHVSHKYSYTGMMAVKLALMRQVADIELPLHWVRKKSGDSFLWKRERFIFDFLPFADRVGALCYSCSQIYAPLKSQENLGEVLRMLQTNELLPC